jgi:hypothetical protein
MKRLFLFLFLIITGVLLMVSCNKQPSSSPGNSYQTVRLYSDSLITTPYNIVAGNNILLMSYETLFYPTEQSTVMATDNKGVVLWKCPIANNIITDILINGDGSYILVGCNPDLTLSPLYLYNLNSAGNVVASYPFTLPFGTNWEFFGTSIYIIKSVTGNNLIYGYYIDLNDANNEFKGFVMECDNSGNMLWVNTYYFPQSVLEATVISDAVITSDGGYLFCGYLETLNSRFFLMKTDSKGDTLWTKFYNTGEVNPVTRIGAPYCGGTSSLIPLNTGNYLLFIGPTPFGDYNSANPSEWIYTVSPSGDSLNSRHFNFAADNYPVQAIMNNKGNIYALMDQTSNLNTSSNGFFPQNTTFESLNANLTINSYGYFQTIYTDYFQSLCFTSDGNIACFGMIQSEGKNYFKPELIITSGK